ncbi:citrate lyase subunit beta [Pseudonocardia sp. HH130630-07]|nr:citrate lyase subunit beta [Pseudonocardia sp. HH130630-07]
MLRSWLFLPADNERFAARALTGDADAVILDLEDAVADRSKAAARAGAARHTGDAGNAARHLYVRINALDTPHALADVTAVVGPGLEGIVLPMAGRAADVEILDWLLTQAEHAGGLPVGRTAVVPLVECAAGVVRMGEIARASTRIRTLAYGSGDLAADVGMPWEATGSGDIGVRSLLALHCRDAGIGPPLDSVSMAIDDEDALRAEAHRSRDLGFGGKLCVHPRQVATINETYLPSAARVEWAHRIIAATDEAEARGAGAVRLDGQLMDIATIESARRILDLVAAAR